MDIINSINSAPLAASFLAPLLAVLPGARHQRSCPEISDPDWLALGVARALDDKPSGRAFLQVQSVLLRDVPDKSRFFEALASSRRLRLCREVNELLAKSMNQIMPDPFADFPELAAFDLYAGDGHFHAAAVHDPRDKDGRRHATGHVFLLNLRSQAMHHLDLCDPLTRRKEHEIRVIKRHDYDTLRRHAPKGRKVIIAYDRAILDYLLWQHAKDTAGLYFVSRPKSNTSLTKCGFLEFDKTAPVNFGVISDEQAAPDGTAKMIRRITWQDPDTGESWQFLTNEMKLAPGLIVLIYRRRWDIEKAFDEFKNKLNEKKSWASSVAAKAAQANFMCMVHNLIVLCNHELEKAGIRNEPEIKRRGQRLADRTKQVTQADRQMPSIISGVQWATQRSVKLIRWIRSLFWINEPLPQMHASLRQLYAAP